MIRPFWKTAVSVTLLGLALSLAFSTSTIAATTTTPSASSSTDTMTFWKPADAWYSRVEAEAKAGRGRAQVASLVAMIDGPDARKRELAAQLLSDIGKDANDAVPSLIRHINDPDFFPRLRCIEALGDIGPDASTAIPSLIDILNDPTWQIVNMAAYSLGSIGPKAKLAVPELEAILQRPENSDRYATLSVTCRVALAHITGKPGLQVIALLSMLHEKNDDKNENWPAYEATRGLGELTPASKVTSFEISQELVNLNAEFTVREEAARDLGIFGDPFAVPFLWKAVHEDPDFTVRDAAIDALGKIEGPIVDTAKLHKESMAKVYTPWWARWIRF